MLAPRCMRESVRGIRNGDESENPRKMNANEYFSFYSLIFVALPQHATASTTTESNTMTLYNENHVQSCICRQKITVLLFLVNMQYEAMLSAFNPHLMLF